MPDVAAHDHIIETLDRINTARVALCLNPLTEIMQTNIARAISISTFAADLLIQNPELADLATTSSLADCEPPMTRWHPEAWPAADDQTAAQQLRHFRKAECLRLILRDILNLDSIEDALRNASDLAKTCIELALRHLEPQFYQRYGIPLDANQKPQRLIVLGMGKLGGGELNFSSDIDLIFAFPETGVCEGGRSIEHEDFFIRLGQQLIQMLDDVTADGCCYRVDMRLRPFGREGRIALSFSAMEHYYQREGRDWERYALIKARPVAGDLDAGNRLLSQLKPFVYRRYLDYSAIDGLREMKRFIDAEVMRQDKINHIKLGPGGIRELEFTVQLLQIVRGGRESTLRTPSFLEALDAVAQAGHLEPKTAQQLRNAYLFLRHVENRLQMWADAQTHDLPDNKIQQTSLAQGLGYATWPDFLNTLNNHRKIVSEAFTQLFRIDTKLDVTSTQDLWQHTWVNISSRNETTLPLPFREEARLSLRDLLNHPAIRSLSGRARTHLDHLLPLFLEQAAQTKHPDITLNRIARLLSSIAGRPTYLSLLSEMPSARSRVVDAFARSAWIAEKITAHPLLLDDLLDTRINRNLPDAKIIQIEIDTCTAHCEDIESALMQIDEAQQSIMFRFAMGWLYQRISAQELTQHLVTLAQTILSQVIKLAAQETTRTQGILHHENQISGFAVLGYGGLGGCELTFNSDLDLVFIFSAEKAQKKSQGTRSIEGTLWYGRLAQRVMHWMSSPIRTTALYAVDTRLRPDGTKGFLATSIEAFMQYQKMRAWTWEHQALVRARWVGGDESLKPILQQARTEILCTPRDPETLIREITDMRERWRLKSNQSTDLLFDIKQGVGGLVDLEFALQILVLLHASTYAELTLSTKTNALLDALTNINVLSKNEADALRKAHQDLLSHHLTCMLNLTPRTMLRAEIGDAPLVISSLCRQLGLGVAETND